MSARLRIAAVGLATASVFALAAKAAAGPGEPGIPFTIVASGQTSGIREPERIVIRERVAWLALWRRHAGPSAPAPGVDFGEEMIVAIFGGSAAPQRLTITRIEREPGRLVVWYRVRAANPLPEGESLTPVSSFQIVRVARSSLPVVFMLTKSLPVVPQP